MSITVGELAVLLKDPAQRAARLRTFVALNRTIAELSAEMAPTCTALAVKERMSPSAELAEWHAHLAMNEVLLNAVNELVNELGGTEELVR
jgi:hypothetical protein